MALSIFWTTEARCEANIIVKQLTIKDIGDNTIIMHPI